MRQSFPAAELGVLAVEVFVLDEEDVEGLRTGMRHQCQHDNHSLAESDVLPSRDLLQPVIVRGCDFLNGRVFAPLLKIQLQGCGQHLVEP